MFISWVGFIEVEEDSLVRILFVFSRVVLVGGRYLLAPFFVQASPSLYTMAFLALPFLTNILLSLFIKKKKKKKPRFSLTLCNCMGEDLCGGSKQM